MARKYEGVWTRQTDPRKPAGYVAPAETPTDAVLRAFASPHSITERLDAIGEFIAHLAELGDLPRRTPAPPADFAGESWGPEDAEAAEIAATEKTPAEKTEAA